MFTVIVPNQAIVAPTTCGLRRRASGVPIAQKVWRLWNEAQFPSLIIREGLPVVEAPRTRFRDGKALVAHSKLTLADFFLRSVQRCWEPLFYSFPAFWSSGLYRSWPNVCILSSLSPRAGHK